MNKKRGFLILAAVLLLPALVFGAGSQETTASGKLTYWIPLGDKASQVVSNNAEILAMQAISENTGIEVEFQHPAIGQEADQFNLMIASRTLPDIVFFQNTKIAENLEMFLPITDKISKFAPNYGTKIQDERIRKALTMNDGEIYSFGAMRFDPTIRVWMGPQIRGDWLDALGMDLPETIEDWYEMLTAFKKNDMNGNGDPNDEIPYVSRASGGYSFLNFASAWGLIVDGFYQVDGTVYYSPVQPEWEDFVTEMNKWYAEGLLDSDWAATDGDSFKAKMTNSVGGSMYGSLIGVMGTFNGLLRDVNPQYHLVGAPWVESMIDGVAYNPRTDHATIVQPMSASISADSENWQTAMTYLDYGYSDEGSLIMNFGVEGVSYKMVNGNPVFTDEVVNNPDGLAFGEALAKYAMTANTISPFIQDPKEFAQASLGTPDQANANALWAAGDQTRLIPSLTLTNEERTEFNEIMSDVSTFSWERTTQFVMGLRDLSEFEAYYATLKSMDVERAIEIQQGALNRYNSK